MTRLSRRGFLGVLSAFAAAAATRAMPSSLSGLPPAPEQTDLVAALLKECRVIAVEQQCMIGDVMRYVVTYRHAPKAQRTCLDEWAERDTAGKRPVSTMLTMQQEGVAIAVVEYV